MQNNLMGKIFGRFAALNSTNEPHNWFTKGQYRLMLDEIDKARTKIKSEETWPYDSELADRTVTVDLTDATRTFRTLETTGQDLVDTERQYMEDAS